MKTHVALYGFLLASSTAFADVIVVDQGGGGDFTTLTAAVAAASDGDVLLMHPGFYDEPGEIVLDDKPLSIIGGTPFTDDVTIRPGITVRNLGAGRNVALQNVFVLGMFGTSVPATPALTLENNVGHVRVQDGFLIGGGGGNNTFPHGALAIDIDSCATTALVNTRVEGGPGQFSFSISFQTGDGASAIRVADSELAIYGGSVTGGSGGGNDIGAWPQGGAGGVGIESSGGEMFLSGASIEGGEGGEAHNGGDGGEGLVLDSGASALFMAGSFVFGGQGGQSDDGPPGANGLSLIDPLGGATDLGGSFHGFSVPSPVRAGEDAILDFGGGPLDSILLIISADVQPDPYAVYQGSLLVSSSPIATLLLGTPGNLNLPFTAPNLGLDSLDLHLQAVYAGSDGIFLGPGRILTMLDSSF